MKLKTDAYSIFLIFDTYQEKLLTVSFTDTLHIDQYGQKKNENTVFD